MEVTEIKYFIEAALLAAGKPLSIDQLQGLFADKSAPEKTQLREAIKALQDDYEPRGIEVAEVASGFRMQVRTSMAERLEKLWEERPPRYSRALFETLALIAYRQPMTRGEIEEVRGVAVSSNIMRTLLEREWVRVVGHRDVPGRPAMFGTTRLFLDYFGLKKLDDLPPLADLSDWESLRVQLNLPAVEEDDIDDLLPNDNPILDADDDDDSHDFDDDAPRGAVVTALPLAERAGTSNDDALADDAILEPKVANDADGGEIEASGAAESVDDDEELELDELPANNDTSASNG
ncbi:MAG: SMC-Scp complex subunit ScpB [Woeseia sp.]